jgi:predicted dehydrogenase
MSTRPDSEPAKPLRVGVVGLVSSYSLLIPEALREIPGVRYVGAAHLGRDDRYMADSLDLPWLERFPKDRASYASTFDVPLYETADELFDTGVDAIVLGTEEYLRTRYALAALERGLHVYLPKPFAYTAEDVTRLRAAQAKSTGTLFPGLPHRWNAHYRRAIELLTPERLGRPLMLRTAITHHLSAGPWKSDPTMAAGPEFEMGFYAVDSLLMVAGSPARTVTATAANFLHLGIDCFDSASLQVRFESGAFGSTDLFCGLHYPFRGHELSATARDGAVWVGPGGDGRPEMRVYEATGPRVEDVPALGRNTELNYWIDVCRRDDREAAAQWFETGCQTLGVLLAFQQAWRTGTTVEITAL